MPLICCNLAASSVSSDATEIFSEPENITVVEKQDGNDRKSVCFRISQLVIFWFQNDCRGRGVLYQTTLLDVTISIKLFLCIIYGSFSTH